VHVALTWSLADIGIGKICGICNPGDLQTIWKPSALVGAELLVEIENIRTVWLDLLRRPVAPVPSWKSYQLLNEKVEA
jgi:hypothetical protein